MLASGPFRKLFAATTRSLFGDFFSYIAMAWLVLQLTGSSLALGTVLVVQALPRAVLMVVGGALADRLSPRLTMLGSMGLRAVFVAPLAVLVLTGHVQMWQVYGIAIVFGVVDAFFMPAGPRSCRGSSPTTSSRPGTRPNVTGQVTRSSSGRPPGVTCADIGTELRRAGLSVHEISARLRAEGTPLNRTGVGQILAEEGFGRLLRGPAPAASTSPATAGRDTRLPRAAVIDFAANGAIGVGLPTLAHGLYAAGATGLGILFAAWGVGATAGALLAGVVPAPKGFGWFIVGLCVWLGAGMAAVGLMPSLVPAAIVMGLSGIGTGVVNTYGISWLQRRTTPTMQGRVMSLVMLASMGLTPIAYAASGAIAEVNPTALFLIAGGMTFLCGGSWPRTVSPVAAVVVVRLRPGISPSGRGMKGEGLKHLEAPGHLMPAATRPAACACEASCPLSSACTAAIANACARCWSRLRSMLASENHAQ